MENRTEITRKDLNFINDIDLREILLERLDELDRVFLANANYSTVFLAISTIEGIFKQIAKIYEAEIKKSPKYPYYSRGKTKKKFEDLTIDDLYILLTAQQVLPIIPNFE